MKIFQHSDPLEKLSWKHLLHRAEAGDSAAQGALGRKYHFGVGVAKNTGEALRWGQLAAQGGSAKGQALLGYYYRNGVILAQDYEQSYHWYQLAAAQGYLPAIYTLGLIYKRGEGVEKNLKIAKTCFLRAARKGHGDAMECLGLFAKEAGNYRKAFRWFLMGGKRGSAKALSRLALTFIQGEGVDPDHDMAMYWAQQAANTGSGVGQLSIGFCYKHGIGCTPDYRLSRRWFLRSARRGNKAAMYQLGMSYQDGVSGRKDLNRAQSWLRRAAELGNDDARLELARREKPKDEPVEGHQVQNPLAWVVTLYPCEWNGRAFQIPTWAVTTQDGLLSNVEPELMDTFPTWGHRHLHKMREDDKTIDCDFLEAEGKALREHYKLNPVLFTDAEIALMEKCFDLLKETMVPDGFNLALHPALNVITACRWAQPITPTIPVTFMTLGVGAANSALWQLALPEIGLVHLTGGNVHGMALERDFGSNLLRVVTLHDHEPDGYRPEEFLWRYSLLLIPEFAFTPDHSKIEWEWLWLHTHYYWSAYLNDFGEKPVANVAVETSQTLYEGIPPYRLKTFSPRSEILGRPDSATEEELKAYNEAYELDPTINSEEWFSYLTPKDDEVIAFVQRCKANPVKFTGDEVALLRAILTEGKLTIRGALEILAAWRWDDPMNIVYEMDIPELCESPHSSDSHNCQLEPDNQMLKLPVMGQMVLSCGEVPVVAVSRVPETGRIRVVTLEESDCTFESVGLEISKYYVFEIEKQLFRTDVVSASEFGIGDGPREIC